MKYNQAQKLCIMIFIPVILFSACKKDLGGGPARSQAMMDGERRTAELSKEIAKALEKIYQYPNVYDEVNATIYSGYYQDERVLLKDLLFPETSLLYASDGFKKFKIQTGMFKKAFNEELKKGDFSLLKAALDLSEYDKQPGTISSADNNRIRSKAPVKQDLAYPGLQLPTKSAASLIFSNLTGAAIYFPYSDNFSAQFKNSFGPITNSVGVQGFPTIVYTDRDSDSGPGREAYSCGTGISLTPCFRNIMVDDAYAYHKPTHIVSIGAEPAKTEVAIIEPVNQVARIYHGWSRLTRQMDKLISLTGNGGGSEVKIARISGYLELKDQQITDFSGDLVTVYYKRSDIRKQNWKRVYSIWDADWNIADREQVYAVYEDDTQGTAKLKGSLTTTLNIPGSPSPGKTVGDIDFDISVITQDEIITQRLQDRDSYFKDALNSQGWGYATDPNDFLPAGRDWPIVDAGTIWSFSMPYRVF